MMTPKSPSGSHKSADPSEIIAPDGNSTRHDIVDTLRDFESRIDAKLLEASQERAKPPWWQTPIIIVPVLLVMFGLVAERALDYGYIKGTKGADGQPVDCFIGPLKDAKFAYVIHQTTYDGSSFDEDKVMLGWASAERAKAAYKSAYNNVDLFYSMSVIPMHEFIKKVLSTKNSKRPGKIHASEVAA